MAKRTDLTRVDMESGELMPVKSQELAVVERLAKAEIDTQIATAKQYPRSITRFKQQAFDMVTADPETAGSMFYNLPRGGKSIEGPSVRLAEVAMSCWGNIRAAARIIDETDTYVVAQGVAHDLENNVAASVDVTRRITNKDGKRYNEDMIAVTKNAAGSVALRNAIFKAVPAVYIKQLYAEARRVAGGEVASLARNRDAMLVYFKGLGVDAEQVCAAVGVDGPDDIGVQHISTLRGIATALKDGDTTLDQAFPAPVKDLKPTKGRQSMDLGRKTVVAVVSDAAEPGPESQESTNAPSEAPEPPAAEKSPEKTAEPPSEASPMGRGEQLAIQFREIAESQGVDAGQIDGAWALLVKLTGGVMVDQADDAAWDLVEKKLSADFDPHQYVK